MFSVCRSDTMHISIVALNHILLSLYILSNYRCKIVQYQVQSLHQNPRANANKRQRLNVQWGYAQNLPPSNLPVGTNQSYKEFHDTVRRMMYHMCVWGGHLPSHSTLQTALCFIHYVL